MALLAGGSESADAEIRTELMRQQQRYLRCSGAVFAGHDF